MRFIKLGLAVIALALSAMPLFWAAIILDTQFGNLWMTHLYWREFPAVLAFWVGFVASLEFFRRCLVNSLTYALSPILLVLISIGLAGGIAEEVMLWDNSKVSFPLGYFEVAPVSWVIVGYICAKMSAFAINRPAKQ